MAAGRKTGGRRRGTPNKAKAQLQQALAAVNERMSVEIPREQIIAMSPLDVMLHAMTHHALEGFWVQAAALAKEAAPYLHAKLTPKQDGDADDGAILIRGGLPDQDAG
jgi:hypothetical protein